EFISGKVNGEWIKYGTQDFCTAVDDLSKGLVGIGIGKASRVAVMSHNRPEWNISDFAIMQIGAYEIPLYPTLAEQDIKFIIEDAEVTLVTAPDELIYKKLQAVNTQLASPVKIYTFNKIEGAEHWTSLLEA